MNLAGKYSNMPPTFKKLKELDEILKKDGYSLSDDLSLILQDDYFAYQATPCDVIPFAYIGVDGIHCGLLTDFGTVTDLEDAFVVCVRPMEFDNPIQIVARNLREFISLICTLKDTAIPSEMDYFESKESFLNFIQEKDDDEYIETADYIVEKIKSLIGCDIIEDPYDYVQRQVKMEREKRTILQTLDGLGVVPLDNEGNHSVYKLERDMDVNLKEVKSFFKKATTESKLAFIRDVQFTDLISDEPELQEFLIDEMLKLGLNDEVERLERA